VVSAKKKLIKGSVIYMKKMRVSKRGFTLTEIIIVVAIMVIIASAAFVGVAVVLENARKNSDDVKAKHGRDESGKELFEAEAWEEIDELTKDAANFFDVSMYKPVHTNTPMPSPTPTDAPSEGDDSSTSPTPTTKPSATSTPLPTSTTAPTPTTGSTGGGGTGFATANNGYVDYYNNGKPGVMNITSTGDNTVTVVFTDGWNNNTPDRDTVTVSITKTNNTYTMKVIDGNGWVATQVTGYNYEGTYTLSSNDITNLKNNTGLTLN
jgi:prepilin-type N-terminal cleavage/methylation domain-containing protein